MKNRIFLKQKLPLTCLKALAIILAVVIVTLLILERKVYDTIEYDVLILIGACLELWTLVQLKRRKVFD